MNLLLTGIFLFFVILFGLTPFPVLYLFSGIIRFMMQKIIGYRRKVILSNLAGAFPGLPEKELNSVAGIAYKNLADIMVEGVKAFSMTRRQIKARHFISNPGIIEAYLSQGRSVIVLPAHFNNWEWGSLSPGLYTKSPVVAFYKPLNNKYIDWFLRKNRSKFGTTLAPILKTAFVFGRNAGKPTVYIMVADQSPGNMKHSFRIRFLGRDTAFINGPERYARKYNLPVVYADIKRVKRGYYTLDIIVISDNPSQLAEGEITARYAKKLEESILKSPGSWLWSHRRWKLTRQVHDID